MLKIPPLQLLNAYIFISELTVYMDICITVYGFLHVLLAIYVIYGNY